ncbi:importin-5-like [Uloborus diversus]|uniref:importin-5-like n=1 Tax=Uloborus diversus TaxID=327109 RepID=UPI00240A42A8|nr:importin-5-like [Uloborus diversus]
MDINSFSTVLSNILSTDNQTRNNAETIYVRIPIIEKVSLLVTVIGNDGAPPEQAELAAALLRRIICDDYEEIVQKLSPDEQCQLKNQLLHRIQQGVNCNLRRKTCDVASELARNCIDDDGNNLWPEFLKFLFDSACSPEGILRELALTMFASVPGVFGNEQTRYLEVIQQMLCRSLTDQESNVRYAAVKATTSFLLAHEKELHVLKMFSECLTLVLHVFSCALDDPDACPDDILRHLIDLAETCPQIFRGQFDVLMQLCLKGITESNEDSCKDLSVEVIVTLSETAPAMVRKLGIRQIPVIIDSILKMMTNLEEDPNWDLTDDDNYDDQESNPVVGEAALDRLSCALSGKTVLPIVLNVLHGMLSSPDWKQRHAALMAISAVGEGCHKQMSALLPQIVEVIYPFMDEPHSRVRYAACNALGQMSTDFAPIFQKKFHDKVIPGLLRLMSDSSPRVQAHAGAALVNFFEECPKTVLSPYMKTIVEKLESVITSKLKELMERGTKLVLEQAVVTLASLADSAEEKFTEYYEKFMPCLKYIIQSASDPNLRVLRGKTIECVSLIGLAVGKEKFLSDASEIMDLLLKVQTNAAPIAEDDPQLSYMIAAWARICKILGKAFEPYLPYVMQPVLKAAAIKPEIAFVNSEDAKVVENDEDWELVNLGEKHNFGIRTAGLDEKATACHMLVCYARELKEGFAAYVEDTVKLMVPMLKFYFHDGVRIAAAEILPCLLDCAKIRGDQYVQEVWRYVLPQLLQAIDSEPEIEVLCAQMAALGECIEVLNYPCIAHDDLLVLVGLLNKSLFNHFSRAQTRDQKRTEEDYDDVLEESFEREDDDDVYLLGKIADVVCTLTATYKQDFYVYFDMLLVPFVRLLEPGRPSTDRQWSLCVFADIIEHGGPACSKYQQYFLQPLLSSISDSDPDLRQTAAYTIGVLGQFGGPEFAQYCKESVPQLIQIINDPQSRSEENVRATENAISAVTKFMASNNSLINLSEMIPMWMSWLPIWEDGEECKHVLGFLCTLLETNNPVLLGNANCNLPRIVHIIAEAFHKEAIEVTSDVGQRLIALMKDIQINAQLFSICVRHLTQQQLAALQSALALQ